MEKTKKPTKMKAAQSSAAAPRYNQRTMGNYVHYAGIPCMDGVSKPIVDVTYTYRKEDVTCKACQKAIR